MTRHVFGITGPIASGKSHALAVLARVFADRGQTLAVVDADAARRHVLYGSNEECHILLRRRLADALGLSSAARDGLALGGIIFYNATKMELYRQLVNPALREEIKKRIDRCPGWVALEWALLREDGLADLCDGPIIELDCRPDVQLQRLSGGDLPDEQLARRIGYQRQLRATAAPDGNTLTIRLDTSDNPSDDAYEKIYEQIVR